jgi:PAS domain S-box-containing protein
MASDDVEALLKDDLDDEPVDHVLRTFDLREVLPAPLAWIIAAGLFAAAVGAQYLAIQSGDALYMPYAAAVLLVAIRFGEWPGVALATLTIAAYATVLETGNAAGGFTQGWVGYLLGGLTMAVVAFALGRGTRRLVASEQRFRASVENLLEPFAIYRAVRDRDGKIVDFVTEYINEAGALANGLPRDRQIGRRLLELFPGRLESGLFDDYVEVVETGKPLVKDAVSIQDLFGEKVVVRAFDLRVTKLGDGIATAWRDITARKAAEQALTESEQRLQTIVESLPVTMLIQDSDLRFTWVAEPKLGFRREDVIGKTDYDFLPPNEAERVVAAKRRVMETGEIEHMDIRLPLGDREYWWESTIAPYTHDDGSVGVVLTTMDITDRKRQDHEREIALLVSEGAADALIGVSLFWMVESWSLGAERLFGYTRDEAVGRPITFLGGESKSLSLAQVMEDAEGGETIVARVIRDLERADGLPCPVEASFAPIRDTGGTQTGIAIVARPLVE